jgi:hypothetical protein
MPDITTASLGSTQIVAGVDEALALVARFLRSYKNNNVYNNGTS